METKLVGHVEHRHTKLTNQSRMEQISLKCILSNEDSTHCEQLQHVKLQLDLQYECPHAGTGGESVY